MSANENKTKQIEILNNRISELSKKINSMKLLNVNRDKIDKKERELNRYIAWRNEIMNG